MTNKTTDEFASRVEEIINRKHLDFKHDAIHTSTQWALQNRPNVELKTIESFIDPIYSKYTSLNQEVNAIIQPSLQVTLGAVEKETSTKEITILKSEVARLDNENGKIKSTYQGKTFLWPVIGFIFGLISTFILLQGEWGYIISALQIIVQDKNKAFWFAVTISGSILVMAHLVPLFVKTYVQSIAVRRIIYFVLVCMILSIFVYLGVLRAQYMKIMQNIDTPIYPFVLMTTVMFIGLYLCIEYFLIPGFPKVKEAFRVLHAWYIVTRNKIRIKANAKQIKLIEQGTTTKLVDRITLISKAKNAEAKINSLYLETCSAAREANLQYRTDNQYPICFSQPVPMLKSLTEDINI
jgi:hypothetical protein